MEEKKQNQLPNHIEEILVKDLKENNFTELFEASEKDIDLKSDIENKELVLINCILANNRFLKKIEGFNNIYGRYIEKFLRLKVSKDRQSRKEFVDINRRDRFEQNLHKISSFKNVLDTKT